VTDTPPQDINAGIGQPLNRINRLYYRPAEAAKMIGVCRRTLHEWQIRRIIPFRKVGRAVLFSAADIQAALDKFTVKAVTDSPGPRKRRAQRISATS
jgi:excisionase family DNA binding protein